MDQSGTAQSLQPNIYLVLYPILAVGGKETKITTELSIPWGKKLVEIFLNTCALLGIYIAVAVVARKSDI